MDIGDGPNVKFYGVQVPEGATIPDDIIVDSYYTSKVEVLKVLKKVKSARMKEFPSIEEATEFNKSHNTNGNVQTNEGAGGNSQKGGPESLPFSSLRIQDLLKLKQAIERGDISKIRELVDSNPRYLIASGDTPALLQERFRYNCLHCAALKGQTDAAEVILNYLSDESFYAKLYPDDNIETRMSYLLDMYVNTPETGRNETPLHLASKFGHVGMVKLLANELAVDTSRVNMDGLTAAQVVCTRAASSASKQQILDILEGQYYIPLFRSDGDDVMPVVGDPWTPGCTDSPSSGDLTGPLRCVHQHRLPAIASSPAAQRLAGNCTLSVKAVAGPMSPQQASTFKKNWASPGIMLTPKGHQPSPLREVLRRDPYKGQELLGRSVAGEMKVPWCEHWEFLGCSVDIRQPEGLAKLEAYLVDLQTNATSLSECAGDTEQVGLTTVVQPSDAPGKVAEEMNLTDDQLANLFSKLSIHSPSSPSYRSDAKCNTNQLLDTASSHCDISVVPSSQDVGAQHCHPQSVGNKVYMPSQRTRLECVLPSIAPFMDKLRTFWPFGKGRRSPQIPGTTSLTEPTSNYTKLKSAHPPILPQRDIPQFRQAVFLKGHEPCKVDSDVVTALKGVDVNPDIYPAVHHWYCNVTRFSEKDRNCWESPMVIKHRQRLRHLADNDTPRRRLKMDV